MISGHYTGDGSQEVIAKNIAIAEKFAIALANKGIGFFCPHCNSAQHEIKGSIIGPQFYVDLNLEIQKRATDAILMIPGWKTSPGAVNEIKLAKKMDKPIFYPNDENDLQEIEMWYHL